MDRDRIEMATRMFARGDERLLLALPATARTDPRTPSRSRNQLDLGLRPVGVVVIAEQFAIAGPDQFDTSSIFAALGGHDSVTTAHVPLEVGNQEQTCRRDLGKRDGDLVGEIGERDHAGLDLAQHARIEAYGGGERFGVDTPMPASNQRNGGGDRMGHTLGPQPLRQTLAEDRGVEPDLVVIHLTHHAALDPSLGGGSSPSTRRTLRSARLHT